MVETDRKSYLLFGVSTALILVLVLLADLSEFYGAFKEANLVLLVPAYFFGIGVVTLWGYTWYSFLNSMDIVVDYWTSLRMFLAGQFFNSITPVGQFGGEPLMAWVISRNTDSSGERSLSAVVSADIVNALPVVTFGFIAVAYLALVGPVSELLIQLALLMLIALVVGLTVTFTLWKKFELVEMAVVGAFRRISGWTGVGSGRIEDLESTMEELRLSFREAGSSRSVLAKTASVAHLAFLSQILCLWFILLSLGWRADLAPLYLTIVASSLANFSPTPGGTGTYEAVMAGSLNLLAGIPFATSLLAAIIFRTTTYWPGLLLGYLSLNSLEVE